MFDRKKTLKIYNKWILVCGWGLANIVTHTRLTNLDNV